MRNVVPNLDWSNTFTGYGTVQLYITVIERKILYGHRVSYTAFPNATRLQQPQLKQQQRNPTTKVHVTKIEQGPGI